MLTFRKLPKKSIEELIFQVELPKNSLALELAPLQFGTDISEKQKTNTPEVTVGYRGAEVKVGEIFAREVSFNYIKPTISAFGLKEHRFSWSLRDESIRYGSHKFVAVIGVPIGTSDIKIGLSTAIKTTRELFIAGDVATTEEKLMDVKF